MPLHHYLPATFLACFSRDTHPQRRQRTLVVGDKLTGKIFTAAASKVAGIHDLYTLNDLGMPSQVVDTTLSKYEPTLHFAIEQLLNRSITAQAWANTLVPFVAALLVRGPDFNIRFQGRLESLFQSELLEDDLQYVRSSDNINMARLMEYQRLLGQVTIALWLVLEKNGRDSLITNDLGYAPFINPQAGHRGMSIPLSENHTLAIIPRKRNLIAYAQNNEWYPIIEYIQLEKNNHTGLNKAISGIAQRFIFGSDDTSIRKYLKVSKERNPVPEPPHLGFDTSHTNGIDVFAWIKIISGFDAQPKDDEKVYIINY